jgi:streptomycin 6-kinase
MSLDLQAVTARLEPRYGKAAHRWVPALPGRLAVLAAEWGLEIGAELKSGNSSVVLSCVGQQGEAILKLSPDAHAIGEQVDALRQFAPSGRVPAVLATARGAVLLEAIHPGTVVEELPGSPAASEYALFLADLHAAGNPASAPRKLAEWMSAHFTVAASRGADLGQARVLCAELIETATDNVLLHGDLHFGNVLVSDSRGLIAVGAKACVGDRCFDAVDYILEAFDRSEMARRRDALAAAAGIDPERLDAWCRAIAPISAVYVPAPAHSAELRAFARGEH